MAITLRRDTGTALTYDQLDDNFVDYTTFRDKFDQTQWIGDNDAKLVFYNNTTGKLELKTLTNNDLDIGAFNTNFNTRLALKTTNDLAEGTNNSVGESAPGLGDGTNRLYYTTTRANADFDTRLATKTTTNLSEGSNLYYTDARVLTKINATSVTQLSDMPATVQTDDAKVITYDYNSDSFRYSTLLTESLLPVTDHGLITDGNVVTGSTGVTTTSLQSLTNVNFASVSGAIDGNVLVYDQAVGEWKAGVVTSNGGVVNTGVTNFLGLSDTPGNFSGEAGKLLRVNLSNDGVDFYTLTTSDIGESGTSFYFTDSRFDTRLSAKSTDDLTEGLTNLYYTNTRADGRIANHIGVNLDLSSKTTNDVPEGTNLYYTDARADARIAAANIFDLANIDTPTAADDQDILFYNHATASFKWGTLNTSDNLPEGTTNLYYSTAKANTDIDARIATTSIDTLSDVDTTGAVNGKILKYNGTTWVVADDASGASSISLTDLSVGAEAAASGDGAIAYDNSTGVFTYTPPDLSTYLTSISSQNLSSLADVNNTSPTDGQALIWDNANSYWKPGTVGGGAGGDITSVTAGTGLTGGGTNGDVTVNVDVGTTANKIMQITADGKLPGVIASEVHKENNKIATAGTITLDCSSKTHFYINVNGSINLRGSNWKPGVRYSVIVENQSGTTVTVAYQRDNGDTLDTTLLSSGNLLHLVFDSFGTNSDAVTAFFTLGGVGYWNNTTI